MAFFDRWITPIIDRIARGVMDDLRSQPLITARAYRQGFYKPQLMVRNGQFDDNLGLNFVGLIANRINSQMFGQGMTLDFEGDTETPQEQYISGALDANHEEILFHRAGLSASESGTGYLYILPEGVVGEDGKVYPRLQLLDPALVTMDTLPEDYEIVIRYTVQYKFMDGDKEKARRKVIEHEPEAPTWTIRDWVQDSRSTRWELVNEEVWPYDFPPIIHWQNMPSVASCYGEPDIDASMLALQDRINFLSSNISKLIRYYAHPLRYAVNVGEAKRSDMGPDEMVRITGADADIRQLEALGDLASSLQFFTMLRQVIFANARVVDIDSIQDKLGSLTNFGLRVLYQDNLNQIATKREIFGDMVEELARRLQILNGMQPVECHVVWPDFLPVNEIEQQQAIRGDIELGLVSLETAQRERGYDPEQEAERMAATAMNDPKFWQGAALAINAGVSLEGYLRQKGVDNSVIQSLLYDGVPEQ